MAVNYESMDVKETIIKELKRSTKAFLEYMDEYASRQTPGDRPECWDVKQVIEHVVLVDRTVLGLLLSPFSQSKTGHYTKYHMRDLMLNRHKKFKSQKNHDPERKSEKKITELLDEFSTLRHEIMDRVADGKIDIFSEDAYPHPALGLLTRRDWLYMLSFHSDRHIAQAQEFLFVH